MRAETAEDLLNEFEWKLAALRQIATATEELWQDTSHGQRWKLGMTPDTARYVFDLYEEFDDMRERITQLEDRAWQPEEEDDAS